MKSVFWLLSFLFSLVFLAAAYYVTAPSVRTAVDARAPWVRTYLGPYIRGGDDAPSEPRKVAAAEAPSNGSATAPTQESALPPAPVVPAAPKEFSLKELAANRSAWPATVTINKPQEFPAVVEGKVVGKLKAPAGTEVGLVTISGGKLGVQYQGGGAWMAVEETDLVARTQGK